jgi:hypothetical protein
MYDEPQKTKRLALLGFTSFARPALLGSWRARACTTSLKKKKRLALLGFTWVYLLVYVAAGAQEHVHELERQGLQGALRAGAPFTCFTSAKVLALLVQKSCWSSALFYLLY